MSSGDDCRCKCPDICYICLNILAEYIFVKSICVCMKNTLICELTECASADTEHRYGLGLQTHGTHAGNIF